MLPSVEYEQEASPIKSSTSDGKELTVTVTVLESAVQATEFNVLVTIC